MQQSILFYFTFPFSPTAGGVERVSCVLGNWFESHGYRVYYLSDKFLSEGKSIFVHNGTGLNDAENFDALVRFVKNKSIKIVINQSAFFPSSKRLFDLRKNGVKIISVVHNSLSAMYSHPPIPVFIPYIHRFLSSRFITFFLSPIFT